MTDFDEAREGECVHEGHAALEAIRDAYDAAVASGGTLVHDGTSTWYKIVQEAEAWQQRVLDENKKVA